MTDLTLQRTREVCIPSTISQVATKEAKGGGASLFGDFADMTAGLTRNERC